MGASIARAHLRGRKVSSIKKEDADRENEGIVKRHAKVEGKDARLSWTNED